MSIEYPVAPVNIWNPDGNHDIEDISQAQGNGRAQSANGLWVLHHGSLPDIGGWEAKAMTAVSDGVQQPLLGYPR